MLRLRLERLVAVPDGPVAIGVDRQVRLLDSVGSRLVEDLDIGPLDVGIRIVLVVSDVAARSANRRVGVARLGAPAAPAAAPTTTSLLATVLWTLAVLRMVTPKDIQIHFLHSLSKEDARDKTPATKKAEVVPRTL